MELFGLCCIRLGEPREALSALRGAASEAPDRPHPHYLLGFAARDLGDLAQAIGSFREAVRLSPDEPVYLRALAELLADQRELGEAMGLARRAVSAAPDTATNHVTLGYVASAAGEVQAAREAYRAAVALDPGDATAWNNLGCAEMAGGDKLAARERFREALRLDPRSERSRRNLALVTRPRPPSICDDFDVFLGEAIQELRAAGLTAIELVALGQAAGGPAVRSALTARVEASGPRARVGVAAGAAIATAAVRLLGPAALLGAGALAAGAGVGYLATVRKVTPHRRRHAEAIALARREWETVRRDWLDGKQTRAARDQAIERLLEKLCVAIARPNGVEGGVEGSKEPPPR